VAKNRRQGTAGAALSRAISLAAGGGDLAVARGTVSAGTERVQSPESKVRSPGDGAGVTDGNLALAGGHERLAGERLARLPVGQLHQRAPGIFASGAGAHE